MKPSFVWTLALAAGAVGFVLPEQQIFAELQPGADRTTLLEDAERLWDHATEDIKTATDTLAQEIYGKVREFEDAFDETVTEGLEAWESYENDAIAAAEGAFQFVTGDDNEKLTLHELIQKSEHTTRIAKLIEEDDELKELLKSTDKEHTFFVPTDEALEKLPKPKKGKHPPKEVIKALLKYHLVPETRLAKNLLGVHTVPTLLGGDQLSHDPAKTPQRLSIKLSLRGLTINRYARVTYPNVRGSNGVIHAVNNLLVPPPRLGGIITILPTLFSTFDLAFKKTELGDKLGYKEHYGATLFAPENSAWKKLGFKANAFLFSKWGNKYLRALLLYHVVGNQTLYSDHFYGPESDDAESFPKGRYHIDLPTLLNDRRLSVDVGRYGGFINMHVNHYSRVGIQDLIARDGVIQVVNSVLIPPHHKHGEHAEGTEICVEDLKERLEPYVDADEAEEIDEDEPDWISLEL